MSGPHTEDPGGVIQPEPDREEPGGELPDADRYLVDRERREREDQGDEPTARLPRDLGWWAW